MKLSNERANENTLQVDKDDSIIKRMVKYQYNEMQQKEAQLALEQGIPESKILEYFYPDIHENDMKQIRERYVKLMSVTSV